MAISANQMKSNLQQARRSHRLDITPEREHDIYEAMKKGISKKAICIVYGLTYADLKRVKTK